MTRVTYYLFFVVSILSQGCVDKVVSKNEIDTIDSLNKKIAELNDEIKTDKQLSPHIQVRNYEAEGSSVILYIPWGLKLALKTTRPQISESISLIVPAAYTSKKMTIDGFLIENGKSVNEESNNKLTGVCIISSNKVDIIPYDKMKLDSIFLNKEESAFQQSLLLYNTEIYPCKIFGNIKSKRRAIIQFEELTCIAESNVPLTILEFQEALKYIGVTNAINLDMGSWSEGSYRDHMGQIIKIGDNFMNSRFQTSWLVYSDS